MSVNVGWHHEVYRPDSRNIRLSRIVSLFFIFGYSFWYPDITKNIIQILKEEISK